MRSRCTNKYFAVLVSLALVSLALGSTRVKRDANKRVPDLSKKQDASQKKDETNSRSKREVSIDVEIPEEVLVEDISDSGSDPIKKLGFDGALLRSKRQALMRFKRQWGGDWQKHPYLNQSSDSEDSDSSESSEETSETSDETSSESSDSETESSESESDSSDDSDDERRRRRRRRRRNYRRWNRRGRWGRW